MALAFRNLTITPSAPVAEWPTEALQAAIERGDLRDWRRIGAELRREPWGRTARQVEEVLSHSRPYGAAELIEELLGHARRRAEADEREAVAAEVRRAVACSGLNKAQFATRIGTSPSRLSTYLSAKVTPSAALMIRMRRLAERAGAEHAHSAGQQPRRAGVAAEPQPQARARAAGLTGEQAAAQIAAKRR